MNLSVLLVSDNETMRRELLTHLAALDHEVIPVSSHELTSLKDEFDLVLIDSELLESKPEILAHWKEHPYSHRAIVVIAPPSRIENVSGWLERGADDWLLYPNPAIVLKVKLDQYVRLKLLDEIPELISSFASSVRPKLTSIWGSAQLMQESSTLSDDSKSHFLPTIIRSVHQLTDLLEDFTAYMYARLSLSIRSEEELRLEEVFESFLMEPQKYLQTQSQTISLNIPHDLPPFLIDRYYLQRLVQRLVETASSCASEDGKISIAIKIEKGSQDLTPITSWLHVTIEYPGVIIDDQDKDRIFEPWPNRLFYKYRRQKKIDTGLELAVVKAQVEARGGHIWVETDLNENAFHFTLPIDDSTNSSLGAYP